MGVELVAVFSAFVLLSALTLFWAIETLSIRRYQPMDGHNQNSGLQNHSLGEIYPYSIRQRGENNLQLIHCLSGEVVREIGFNIPISHQGGTHHETFSSAHRKLENLALQLKGKQCDN